MPRDGRTRAESQDQGYSSRHRADLDAIGTGSRAVEPDGTAQHAAFQVCSEKCCTKEADPSDPTRTSRYEARAIGPEPQSAEPELPVGDYRGGGTPPSCIRKTSLARAFRRSE